MRQYLDLLARLREHGHRKGRPHRHRHASASSARRCASTSPQGFPLRHHQEAAPASRSSTSCCGSCAARPTCAICASNGVTIWDEWADENGELGPVYGAQWRSWPAPDGAHHRPDRRGRRRTEARPRFAPPHRQRLEPGELDKMALPPCHCLFQFYVADGQALLPALSALGRHLPRRALQHRLLCAADA